MIIRKSPNGNYFSDTTGKNSFFVLNGSLKDQVNIFRQAGLSWVQLPEVAAIVSHNPMSQFGRRLIRAPTEFLYVNNKLVNCQAANTSFVVQASRQGCQITNEGYQISKDALQYLDRPIEFNLDRMLAQLVSHRREDSPEVDVFLGASAYCRQIMKKSYDLKCVLEVALGKGEMLERTLDGFARQEKKEITLKVLHPDYVRKIAEEGSALARISSVYSDKTTVTINLAHLNYCSQNVAGIGKFK